MGKDLVLVTGGSGFIGVHCIVQLLQAGYRVRTTVRSLAREAGVRAMVQQGRRPGLTSPGRSRRELTSPERSRPGSRPAQFYRGRSEL